MNLNRLLSDRKSVILQQWFDAVVNTYPPETSSFLKSQKNQFTNPVGSTIYRCMEGLLERLIHDNGFDDASYLLDDIIKIMAVQDIAPSQSLAFIFHFKSVIREELGSEASKEQINNELLHLESKIDKLALVSFDIYMKCKEKIYELRANEFRNMTSKLVERANHIFEMYNRGTDSKKECITEIN